MTTDPLSGKLRPEKWIRISALRRMTAKDLRSLSSVLVIAVDDSLPIAAVIPYADYIESQAVFERLESYERVLRKRSDPR